MTIGPIDLQAEADVNFQNQTRRAQGLTLTLSDGSMIRLNLIPGHRFCANFSRPAKLEIAEAFDDLVGIKESLPVPNSNG